MKFTILTLVLMFSFTATSQVKTGSGGALDTPEYNPIVREEFESMASENAQEGNLLILTNLLDTQERNCRSKGHYYLSLNERDFMQAYLKLSTLQSSFVADDKCQDISTYFKCLASGNVKEHLENMKKDKKMRSHLQKKYKIKKKEALKMLEFFQTLDQGCQNDGCRM